ncbi:MAG: hypothetical protein V3W44_04370 [Dehalococcoidales bacterium]
MSGQLKIAPPGSRDRSEQIYIAISRGWLDAKGLKEPKEDKNELARRGEIQQKIEDLLKTDDYPRLGCATTRQLIDEIVARLDINLDYRTIDSA